MANTTDTHRAGARAPVRNTGEREGSVMALPITELTTEHSDQQACESVLDSEQLVSITRFTKGCWSVTVFPANRTHPTSCCGDSEGASLAQAIGDAARRCTAKSEQYSRSERDILRERLAKLESEGAA